jgi:hypothetical protein
VPISDIDKLSRVGPHTVRLAFARSDSWWRVTVDGSRLPVVFSSPDEAFAAGVREIARRGA